MATQITPSMRAPHKDYISCPDTAKLVRAALKKAFPFCTFWVRSDSYAGGASIDSYWMDGPTEQQVDHVTHPYCGGSFDGMTDSMSYHDGELNERRVHYMADFIHGHRAYSPEFLTRVAHRVCARYGLPTEHDGQPIVTTHLWWRAGKKTDVLEGQIANWTAYVEPTNGGYENRLQTLIWRELQRSASASARAE